MKILALSDEECPGLWEYYNREKLREYDLILSCGDLKAEYLSFLVTMGRCPLLYVHGNHDAAYDQRPPEGCDCIDDSFVVYNGLRILGLGGCYRYHNGPYHYTEAEMRRRIRRLRFQLWLHGGVDIVVTHAPLRGVGDGEDTAHRGFEAFWKLLDAYHPQYWLHGHIHRCYGMCREQIHTRGETTIINVCPQYTLEVPPAEFPEKYRDELRWKTPKPKLR